VPQSVLHRRTRGGAVEHGLVHTILGTASGARNIGTNGAIAVGGVHRARRALDGFEWILQGLPTREGTRTAQGAPDER
jgi:hypothetical protein